MESPSWGCIHLSGIEQSAAMHARRSMESLSWVCIHISIRYGAVSCDACTRVDGEAILGIHTSISYAAVGCNACTPVDGRGPHPSWEYMPRSGVGAGGCGACTPVNGKPILGLHACIYQLLKRSVTVYVRRSMQSPSWVYIRLTAMS